MRNEHPGTSFYPALPFLAASLYVSWPRTGLTCAVIYAVKNAEEKIEYRVRFRNFNNFIEMLTLIEMFKFRNH